MTNTVRSKFKYRRRVRKKNLQPEITIRFISLVVDLCLYKAVYFDKYFVIIKLITPRACYTMLIMMALQLLCYSVVQLMVVDQLLFHVFKANYFYTVGEYLVSQYLTRRKYIIHKFVECFLMIHCNILSLKSSSIYNYKVFRMNAELVINTSTPPLNQSFQQMRKNALLAQIFVNYPLYLIGFSILIPAVIHFRMTRASQKRMDSTQKGFSTINSSINQGLNFTCSKIIGRKARTEVWCWEKLLSVSIWMVFMSKRLCLSFDSSGLCFTLNFKFYQAVFPYKYNCEMQDF